MCSRLLCASHAPDLSPPLPLIKRNGQTLSLVSIRLIILLYFVLVYGIRSCEILRAILPLI